MQEPSTPTGNSHQDSETQSQSLKDSLVPAVAEKQTYPPEVSAAQEPPTFPEGGLRAWCSVIGGSLVLFVTFGAVQSFGVYQDFYTVCTRP